MALEERQTARALMRAEFVGREPELAVLTGCLAEALSGQPRVVLCRGEAGIGKTRLAEELLARARAHGALGVWGAADESVGLPPYWPWSQAFRAIARTLDLSRLAKQGGLTADLARVAPDVFAGGAANEATAGSMDDRVRQFHGVAHMLRWVCQQIPLVIVLEDAHWGDQPSLLLLEHVVRGLTDERLLLMVSTRDLEHRSGEQLSRVLRHPTARFVELGGLSEPEVRRQLANVLGRPVGDAEVSRTCARTRGNPFLVQEVGRALTSGGAARDAPTVTPTLRAAIAGRLERLSTRTARVIESASVLGQEFSAALLTTMLEVPALECLAALDEAQRAALVEPGSSSDEFRFVHALVRDAIEAGLSRPYLVHLHRLAAEAITRRYANPTGPHLFDLAHHSAEAAVEGDPVTAARWIERAAEQGLRQLGYEEAARLFAQALRVGGAALEDEHRVRLLLAQASALNLAGDLGGRLRHALEAAENARRLQRPDLIAQAALVMEATGLPGFDIATRRLCHEALAGLSDGDATLRARTTARFAETFIYLADIEAAEHASRNALELAEAVQDPLALAAALRARQVVCAGPDRLEVRADVAERLLALSQRTADPKMEFWARCWRIDVWFEQGDLGRIAAELDALHLCAQELGGPVARFTVLHSRAALAQAQGRFADAQQLIDAAFAALAATDYAQRFYVRAAVVGFLGHHVGQNDDTLAAAALRDAPPETIGTPPLIGPLAHALALAEAGRLEDAANLYRSLGPVATWRPAPHIVLLVYALGIAIARLLNETSDVATLRNALLPHRGHHVVSGIGAMAYFGPVELWLGIAAASLGLLDDAIADLQKADDICRANGALGFEIESMSVLAGALVRRGRPEDMQRASQLLANAGPRAIQLGMRPVATSIEGLNKQLAAEEGVQLSGRELEVAQLVADGLTNRQISERLIISERTAQNHVQHILTKLGLANRSQIARRFATRK